MFLAPPVRAVVSNWQEIRTTDPSLVGAHLFLDRNSILKSGSVRQFKVLINSSEPAAAFSSALSGGKSAVEVIEVDCVRTTRRIVSLALYVDAWGKEMVSGSEKKGGPFSDVAPESADQAVMDYVCSQWR